MLFVNCKMSTIITLFYREDIKKKTNRKEEKEN